MQQAVVLGAGVQISVCMEVAYSLDDATASRVGVLNRFAPKALTRTFLSYIYVARRCLHKISLASR